MRIKSFDVLDVRFPTSLVNAGTDAVHKDPDYSAAYVILRTDGDHEGHGFAFTIGRGNEVVVQAIRALEPGSSESTTTGVRPVIRRSWAA